MQLILARGLNPGDVQVLVGLDDGQGFNKIAFTLIEKEKDEKDGRSRRSEGLFPRSFKSSGVSKLFLAAVVPKNHHNQLQANQHLGAHFVIWPNPTQQRPITCLSSVTSPNIMRITFLLAAQSKNRPSTRTVSTLTSWLVIQRAQCCM